MTTNDRKKLKELIENMNNLNRDLDIFLDGANIRKVDPFLHDWVAYNDRRLNLLIEIVKILMKGRGQDDTV